MEHLTAVWRLDLTLDRHQTTSTALPLPVRSVVWRGRAFTRLYTSIAPTRNCARKLWHPARPELASRSVFVDHLAPPRRHVCTRIGSVVGTTVYDTGCTCAPCGAHEYRSASHAIATRVPIVTRRAIHPVSVRRSTWPLVHGGVLRLPITGPAACRVGSRSNP